MKREISKTLTLGVDLGGTKVEVALIDGEELLLMAKAVICFPNVFSPNRRGGLKVL
jgi:activator of 2-hydroxyglutaryl-CoA dehydratase